MNYKKTNLIFIIAFLALLIVPILCTNYEKGAISEIDNRKLAKNPIWMFIGEKAPLGESVENYLNDRLGFRKELINFYQKTNEKVFGTLVHPLYFYGENQETFYTGDMYTFDDRKFLNDFLDFIESLQQYCDERDIDFVVQLEPDKSYIESDKLPNGVSYDEHWVCFMHSEFDRRNIHYVKNLELFSRLYKAGEPIYNHKYDAGHYNDLGAFYSVNNVLEYLHSENPDVHINSMNEYELSYRVEKYLPQSIFLIDEKVPELMLKNVERISADDEYISYLEIDSRTKNGPLEHFKNNSAEVGNTRGLVFGGSHMDMNSKFYANAFSDNLNIASYYNILNYDYYIDEYNPDVVVFEIAQRAILERVFPLYGEGK